MSRKSVPISSWLDASRRVDDPREARGGRHPFASILALAFLGLLCRQTATAGLQRRDRDHRRTLKAPLGFTRKMPPHATNISRALAGSSLGPSRDGLARRLAPPMPADRALAVAADGKTSKPGRDDHGEPVHRLNLLAHDLHPGPAQSPVTGGEPTEPQARERGLKGLLEHDPSIRLFTADALFRQRPPARVIPQADRDFLVTVEDDRPASLEAILTSLGDATGREPGAKSAEKKGTSCARESSGSRKARRSPASAGRPSSPASG